MFTARIETEPDVSGREKGIMFDFIIKADYLPTPFADSVSPSLTEAFAGSVKLNRNCLLTLFLPITGGCPK